jgi:hypothetical protein
VSFEHAPDPSAKSIQSTRGQSMLTGKNAVPNPHPSVHLCVLCGEDFPTTMEKGRLIEPALFFFPIGLMTG